MWPGCYAVHSNPGSDCVTSDVSELPDQISSPKQLDPHPQTGAYGKCAQLLSGKGVNVGPLN